MKKMLKAAAALAAILIAFTLGACDNGSSSGSGGGGGGGSGSGGGGGSTTSSKNPFGFTEEDKYKYFCLDKDGKVLQNIGYSSDEGENVEGAVFLVLWTLTDGTGEVELYQYYGDYEDVTIPDGVTKIGGSAFYECTSLASATIPDGVTEIGSRAFAGCTSLASVTIPSSVTEIGRWAFYGCSKLTKVTFTKPSGWHADRYNNYPGYYIEDMSNSSINAEYLKNTSLGTNEKDWGARRLYRE